MRPFLWNGDDLDRIYGSAISVPTVIKGCGSSMGMILPQAVLADNVIAPMVEVLLCVPVAPSLAD